MCLAPGIGYNSFFIVFLYSFVSQCEVAAIILQFCSPDHSLHIIQCSVKDTLLLGERTYLPHLVVAEGKVKYLDVFLDIIGVGGTGDDGEAFLNVPAQDDLGGRFAMVLSYLLNDRITK